MHNLNSLVSVCGWKQNTESECIVKKIILLNVYVNKSDKNDLWNAEFTIIMRNIRCHSNKFESANNFSFNAVSDCRIG